MQTRTTPLEAVLTAYLTIGIIITVSTELISLGHWLTRSAIAMIWAVVVLTILATRPWRSVAQSTPPSNVTILATPTVLLTLLVALTAPPNTFDSQTYHMARIWHWMQNQSIAFYPTHILRQLHQAPFAEYAILHLQLLTGSDHLDNLVQWASMMGCLAGVTLIASDLGATRNGQGIAAVAAATIPVGVLEASSTQTDYVVALWLVCLVVGLRRLIDTFDRWWAIWTGAALGLALLTKATTYLYAAPFVLWAGQAMLRRHPRSALHLGILAAAVALALNAGHYTRTMSLYGSPLGPGSEGVGMHTPGDLRYMSDLHTPPALLSGVIRNLALHVIPPDLATSAVTRIHAAIGISADDPRTTWAGQPFIVPTLLPPHEDSAGAPIHLALSLIAGMLALRLPRIRAYPICLLVGGLLFACYLRWQPWHARLHLPLFVLATPLIGHALGHAQPYTQRITGALLLLAALPALLLGMPRPLVGPWSVLSRDRESQRFTARPEIQSPYEAAARAIMDSGCHDIGLIMGIDDWEYPLLTLLEPGVRVRHTQVSNISMKIAESKPGPCLIAAWTGDRWKISKTIPDT